MDCEQLCVQDLNQIIKMFSYAIQERIDELTSPTTTHPPRPQDEMSIPNKYQTYKVKHPRDIQSVNKFCQRIMQIFSYFKTRSNHKSLLNLLEQKLVNSMDGIIRQLMRMIVVFIKTPFNGETGRKNAVQLSMSSVKLKINAFQKHRGRVPYSNPFSQIPNCVERCVTSSAQPTKFIDTDKPESRHLKTSISGVQIRRNVSDVNKSHISKRPLRTHEDDIRHCTWLDLDKRYILQFNHTINGGMKEGHDRLQKEFLKRNQTIKLNIQSYAKQFEDRGYSADRIHTVLEEVTLKKHNIPEPMKRLKNGRFAMKGGMEVNTQHGKRDAMKKSRAHTSMKDDEHEVASNLFRQRRYKKAYQQNLHPKTSLTNSSCNAREQAQMNVIKIV